MRLAITFIICLCSLTAMAQPLSEMSGDYESELKKGIEAFYQTRWDEASAVFDRLRQRDPDDPRAYFFESMIPFWDYFFGGNTEQSAERFLRLSEKAINISYRQLKENPHDTTMVLMLSGLYGYRSLVAAGEGNYQTAIRSGMTGYTYTRQLLSLDADDPKALIGKGIFHYMLGSVPKNMRWMTNMMGIKGDMQEGFDLLEQAARSDSYVSNDARMILVYLYKRENRYQEALSHIEELRRRYGENIIFQYNYADLLEKCDRLSEARQAYRAVTAMPGTHLEELKIQSRERLRQL